MVFGQRLTSGALIPQGGVTCIHGDGPHVGCSWRNVWCVVPSLSLSLSLIFVACLAQVHHTPFCDKTCFFVIMQKLGENCL